MQHGASRATGPIGRRSRVIAIVGPSGVGKTSLLEILIEALGARGLAVGAVKHASHGFLADRPGKDSHRLYASGAAAVALLGGEQGALFVRRAAPVSIAAALELLPHDLDLVLAEGFSWEPIPRVLVTGPGFAPRADDTTAGEVVAIVAVRAYVESGPPYFEAVQVEALVEWLASVAAGGDAWRGETVKRTAGTAAAEREQACWLVT